MTTWIQNYLIGRTQVTVVDAVHSDSVEVTSGVPQGSVLGPLLFVLYLQDLINTININCHNTTTYAFVDDVKLISDDAEDLQRALCIVDNWTSAWELTLNKGKSEHLTVREKSPQVFYIGTQSIPKVKSVRDLGVTLMNDLKWNLHINKIRSKANTLSHIILRTFTTNNTQLLINLFKTYIRPTMEYNTCTWSPYLKTRIKEAERIQKMFTRRVCQRANIRFTSYKDRLERLNLESLETRWIKNDLTFLYKIINNIIDMDHTKYFNFSRFGQYNLRRHSLHIARKKPPNTLCRQNFFSLRVIKHWNELPASIVLAPTLSIFKHKIKHHNISTNT